MAVSESWTRWRYKYVPDQIVGEILAKNWIDTLIPVVILLAVLAFFNYAMPGFLGGSVDRLRVAIRQRDLTSGHALDESTVLTRQELDRPGLARFEV